MVKLTDFTHLVNLIGMGFESMYGNGAEKIFFSKKIILNSDFDFKFANLFFLMF